MDWTNALISVLSSVLVGGVAYGVIITKIGFTERQLEKLAVSIHDLRDGDQIAKLQSSRDMSAYKQEVSSLFVTYRQFESFSNDMRRENDEMKQDVKTLLSMVTELRREND